MCRLWSDDLGTEDHYTRYRRSRGAKVPRGPLLHFEDRPPPTDVVVRPFSVLPGKNKTGVSPRWFLRDCRRESSSRVYSGSSGSDGSGRMSLSEGLGRLRTGSFFWRCIRRAITEVQDESFTGSPSFEVIWWKSFTSTTDLSGRERRPLIRL